VHPALIEVVERGKLLPLAAPPAGPRGLSADERALLAFLEELRRLPSIRLAPSRRAAA
jgi:DNA topoisomerase-1